MQKGFDNSSKDLNYDITLIMKSFQNKSFDPMSADKMIKANPKIDSIRISVELIRKEIKLLKDELSNAADKNNYKEGSEEKVRKILAEERLHKIFGLGIGFKAALFNIDNDLKPIFDTSLSITNISGTGNENTASEFLQAFEAASVFKALCLLSKFESNILITQKRIFQYYDFRTMVDRDWYQVESVLVGQSANIVKPGERLKITAGVGAFSMEARPEIYINRKKKDINAQGVAEVEIMTSKRPGKYYVPVNITYTTKAKKQETKTFKLEYTVADIK